MCSRVGDLAPDPKSPTIAPGASGWSISREVIARGPSRGGGGPDILLDPGERKAAAWLRSASEASLQPPHPPPFLFLPFWSPCSLSGGGGTWGGEHCRAELRLRLGFQLHPFLGWVALADGQTSLVSLPHIDSEYRGASPLGSFEIEAHKCLSSA